MALFASAFKRYGLAAELNSSRVSRIVLSPSWRRFYAPGRTYIPTKNDSHASRVGSGYPVTRLTPPALASNKENSVYPSIHRLYCTLHNMSSQEATKASEVSADVYRLPQDIKPTHYDLCIRTDLEALTFDGEVSIE